MLLEDIFKPKAEDRSNNDGFFRFIYGANPNLKTPKMTTTYDDRTNSVIVTAPVELLAKVDEVIGKLDSNDQAEEALFIYHLRNAQSDNLEIVLNVLFGNIQSGQQGQNQSQDQQQQEQFRQRPRKPPERNGTNNGNANNNRNNQNNRATRGGQNRGRGNRNQVPQGLQRATTELSGKVFVVADTDTNSLLVTTASKYRDQVTAIIAELDRSVPQVLIKVLIAEVRHTDDVDYGVDFSVLNKRDSGKGQSLGTNFGNATAAGGLVVSVLEETSPQRFTRCRQPANSMCSRGRTSSPATISSPTCSSVRTSRE